MHGFSTSQIIFAIICRYFDVDWAKRQLRVGAYVSIYYILIHIVSMCKRPHNRSKDNAANAGVSTSAAGLEDAT